MKQNITLYLGDNASGKTRYLKQVISEEQKAGNTIVTNIAGYRIPYATDKEKLEILKNSNNRRFDNLIVDGNIETSYEAYVYDLMKLLYARGNVLVIDELDASLISQDIVLVSKAIADIRSRWKNIYTNGYSMDILRLFTDVDKETYQEVYQPNIYKVSDNMKIEKLTEEQAYAYFDEIRG